MISALKVIMSAAKKSAEVLECAMYPAPVRRLRFGSDLYNCWRNFHRTQAKLDRMCDEWARLRAPCCPGCMFGREWTLLVEKNRNREQLLVGKGVILAGGNEFD